MTDPTPSPITAAQLDQLGISAEHRAGWGYCCEHTGGRHVGAGWFKAHLRAGVRWNGHGMTAREAEDVMEAAVYRAVRER